MIKKRRHINKGKEKTSIDKKSLRKASISSLDNFDKIELLIPILIIKTFILKIEDIHISIIGTNTYHTTYCIKKAQIFIILIKAI